jgi:hypothetical protein
MRNKLILLVLIAFAGTLGFLYENITLNTPCGSTGMKGLLFSDNRHLDKSPSQIGFDFQMPCAEAQGSLQEQTGALHRTTQVEAALRDEGENIQRM